MSVHRLAAASAIACLAAAAVAQEVSTAEPIPNWTAPPFWTPPRALALEHWTKQGELEPLAVETVPTGPLPFFGITPCRLLDTRPPANNPLDGDGIYGADEIRTYTLPGNCGLPGGAQAVSLNVTATNTGSGAFGHIKIWPSDQAEPNVSTLNYPGPGATVANAAVVPLSGAGAIKVKSGNTGADVILDVNGYYAAIAIVNTLNGLSGAVTLAAGTNVSITPSGNTLTIGTDATSSNTPNAIVRRDGTGGFSAGTVALSGNLTLPASSSSAGSLVQSGTPLLHTFGTLNVFLGANSGNFTMTGPGNNTAIGAYALGSNTMGGLNTATGALALANNTIGIDNTATGQGALQNNEGGSLNTAIGTYALFNNSSGGGNIAVGFNAGGNLTTGSDNIDIGNSGVAAESGTIRIGTGGTQTKAFLAGVRGVMTGAADGLAVLIDSNGQLGTASSSASAKREIADVGEASSSLLKLRPVSFFYRNDTQGIRQYGLIAEEVARVMPELVEFSAAGTAEAVRYHFLAPLLLNELQKEQRRNEEQELRIEKLLVRLEALEAQVTECEAPTK